MPTQTTSVLHTSDMQHSVWFAPSTGGFLVCFNGHQLTRNDARELYTFLRDHLRNDPPNKEHQRDADCTDASSAKDRQRDAD